MSWEALARIKQLGPEITANEKYILWMLAYHHNDESGQCNPSLNFLATETNLHRTSIIRIIESLEEKQFLFVERNRDGRGHISNQYQLLFLLPPSSTTLPPSSIEQLPPSSVVLPKQNSSENKREQKKNTPDTLGRVSAPKAASPPEQLLEFHHILSKLPGYDPTPDFWDQVVSYDAGLDLLAEARRMVVWRNENPRRKGTTMFVLNWLQRAGQKIVREANERRRTDRAEVNPFSAYA